jgi:HPt (histidine-containing phosphotransfer) domain-containing protein
MSAQKITNLDQLRSLTGGNTDLIKKFVNTFLQTAPQKLKELELGIKENNAAVIKAIAHSSKSQFAYMGMIEAKALFEQIEQLALESKVNEIEKIYSEILEQTNKGISELEEILNRSP